jgi:hypothetical protein
MPQTRTYEVEVSLTPINLGPWNDVAIIDPQKFVHDGASAHCGSR